MSVPRYIATRVRPGSTVNAAFERVVVLFTDHEAALAAAATEHWLTVDKQGYDAGWNAALDAAIKVVSSLGSCFECEHPQTAIAALRRPDAQPEACRTTYSDGSRCTFPLDHDGMHSDPAYAAAAQPESCSTCGHTDDDICYREDCPAIDRLIEAGP